MKKPQKDPIFPPKMSFLGPKLGILVIIIIISLSTQTYFVSSSTTKGSFATHGQRSKLSLQDQRQGLPTYTLKNELEVDVHDNLVLVVTGFVKTTRVIQYLAVSGHTTRGKIAKVHSAHQISEKEETLIVSNRNSIFRVSSFRLYPPCSADRLGGRRIFEQENPLTVCGGNSTFHFSSSRISFATHGRRSKLSLQDQRQGLPTYMLKNELVVDVHDNLVLVVTGFIKTTRVIQYLAVSGHTTRGKIAKVHSAHQISEKEETLIVSNRNSIFRVSSFRLYAPCSADRLGGRRIFEQENPLTVCDGNSTFHFSSSRISFATHGRRSKLSLQDQRQGLPTYTLKNELVVVVHDNRVVDTILFVSFLSYSQNKSVPWKFLAENDSFTCHGPGIFVQKPKLSTPNLIILAPLICGVICIGMIICPYLGIRKKKPKKNRNPKSKNGKKIGQLFVSNNELAKGSNGTIVFSGTYMDRKVAVKRMLNSFYNVATKEIHNLIRSDNHPNIVRYYGVERDRDFTYLSLECCDCNLDDLIKPQSPTNTLIPNIKLLRKNGFPKPSLLRILRDMVSGVEHMHKEGIIHRDLKPQNILIRNVNPVCAKIADLGISKTLAPNTTSLTLPATGSGTFGWEAPETLRGERQTRGVDLFSMGCIIFYSLTQGVHPFGEESDRAVNIRNNNIVNMQFIEKNPEAYQLVCHLLDPVCDDRPKASEVLLHPFFWDSDTKLSFLRDASDRLEKEKKSSLLLFDLESKFSLVVSNPTWNLLIDSSYLSHMNLTRRYNYNRVQDLLRFVRNSYNHFGKLPSNVQGFLKNPTKGLDDYFIHLFPELLMHIYEVIRKHCYQEQGFSKYFKGSGI